MRMQWSPFPFLFSTATTSFNVNPQTEYWIGKGEKNGIVHRTKMVVPFWPMMMMMFITINKTCKVGLKTSEKRWKKKIGNGFFSHTRTHFCFPLFAALPPPPPPPKCTKHRTSYPKDVAILSLNEVNDNQMKDAISKLHTFCHKGWGAKSERNGVNRFAASLRPNLFFCTPVHCKLKTAIW